MIKSISIIVILTLFSINSNADQGFFSNKTLNSAQYAISLTDLLARLEKLQGVSAGCKTAIQTETLPCITKASEKWNDESKNNYDKAQCCAIWDVMDCAKENSKSKCTEDEMTKVWNELEDVRNDPDCKSYGYHSSECSGSISVKISFVLTIVLAFTSMIMFK